MRIAFAGGGTGGHVFPIQSLIKYMRNIRPLEDMFFWFGEKPSLEFSTYTKLTDGIKNAGGGKNVFFVPIYSGKRRRQKDFSALIKNIVGLLFLLLGVIQSFVFLLWYKIDKVFCKGGYVSLPVVIAARILRKPVFLHESDTKPGLANRMCSTFATTIFTGFPNVFPGKEYVVGQILDDDIAKAYSKADKATFVDGKTHVLVVGGSQGSQSIYVALLSLCEKWSMLKEVPQFHVILGTQNQQLAKEFSRFPFVHIYDFVDQGAMGELLMLSDVSVTRGGTTSLAEQQLYGIKKIIIPIPWTHDQLRNAQYYANYCGDEVLQQPDSSFDSASFKAFRDSLEDMLIQFFSYKKPPFPDPHDQLVIPKEKIVAVLMGKQ